MLVWGETTSRFRPTELHYFSIEKKLFRSTVRGYWLWYKACDPLKRYCSCFNTTKKWQLPPQPALRPKSNHEPYLGYASIFIFSMSSLLVQKNEIYSKILTFLNSHTPLWINISFTYRMAMIRNWYTCRIFDFYQSRQSFDEKYKK